MKKFWFYIEPYSFIFEGSQGLLLYNTLNGKSSFANRNTKAAETLHEVLNSERYGILLSENEMEDPTLKELILDARGKYSADLINMAYMNGLPFSFKPILDLLNDPVKSVSEESNKFVTENVLSYLHELNIYTDSKCNQECAHCRDAYKQCIFCTKFEDNVMTIDDYETLFISISHLGLKVLNLLTNCTDLIRLYEITKTAVKYGLNPCIYVNYLNVNDDFIAMLERLPANRIIILFDVDFLYNWRDIVPSSRWLFVVKGEDRFAELLDLIDNHHLDAEIKPLYSGSNVEFFKNNIYTSEQDLYEIPISKKEIFIRQTLNGNLFGKLTITPTGDIYANVNREPLVNIKHSNLREAIYKELNDGTSWMYTRNTKECKDCVYKYLCPSPNNYELFFNKNNLCNL